jgi:glucokinase
VVLDGPLCHCGNRGCLEALASGWAIAQQAQEAVAAKPDGGAMLLKLADGQQKAITAEIVAQAAKDGDVLAQRLLDEALQALIAGAVSLVNAFNPCRLILGGGVIEGLPAWVDQVDRGVRQRALAAARAPLQVVSAALHGDAGVVGAAALSLRRATEGGRPVAQS